MNRLQWKLEDNFTGVNTNNSKEDKLQCWQLPSGGMWRQEREKGMLFLLGQKGNQSYGIQAVTWWRAELERKSKVQSFRESDSERS